jgi:hypothetical protein
MNPEMIIPSKVSQTEKDKYHDITYMWSLKNELICKTEIDSQTQKNKHGYQRGYEVGEGYTLLGIK